MTIPSRFHTWASLLWKPALGVLFAAFVLRSAGCQFNISGNPDVNLLTLHASPDSAVVPYGGSIVLTAQIVGYQDDGSVTWTVVGASPGSIVSNGLTATYTATGFNVLKLPQVVQIKVVPNEDPTRYVICNVDVASTIDARPEDTSFYVSPRMVRLLTSHSQQFLIDTLSFDGVDAIRWSVLRGQGSISSTGLYMAPANAADSTIEVIRATLIRDTSVHYDATIVLVSARDSILCFTRDVLPIVSGACGSGGCHDAAAHSGGYNFNTYSGMKGSIGNGGARASRLYQSIIRFDAASRMPPPPAPALSPNQVLTIGRWIDEGGLDCP